MLRTIATLAMMVVLFSIVSTGCRPDDAGTTASTDPALATAAAPVVKLAAPQDEGQKEQIMPRIADYYGNRRGALSLTFDDGFRQEVADAREILDPLGLKGTFFLIPMHMENPAMGGNMISWQQAKELHAAGHEIGTHGAIKEKLHEATDERLGFLINESWRLIREKTDVTPVTYALPGGSRATENVRRKILEKHYFIRSSAQFPIMTTAGYGNTDRRQWDDERTRQRIIACRDEGGWFVAIIHSIVGAGWSPFKSKDEFRTHCQWLDSQKDTIWIAPMGTIGRYIRAREAARLEVIERGENSIRLSIATRLEPADVFQVPLTVVIPAPQATSARATVQGDAAPANALTTRIAEGNILVDIMPDGQPVTITWSTATAD